MKTWENEEREKQLMKKGNRPSSELCYFPSSFFFVVLFSSSSLVSGGAFFLLWVVLSRCLAFGSLRERTIVEKRNRKTMRATTAKREPTTGSVLDSKDRAGNQEQQVEGPSLHVLV